MKKQNKGDLAKLVNGYLTPGYLVYYVAKEHQDKPNTSKKTQTLDYVSAFVAEATKYICLYSVIMHLVK